MKPALLRQHLADLVARWEEHERPGRGALADATRLLKALEEEGVEVNGAVPNSRGICVVLAGQPGARICCLDDGRVLARVEHPFAWGGPIVWEPAGQTRDLVGVVREVQRRRGLGPEESDNG